MRKRVHGGTLGVELLLDRAKAVRALKALDVATQVGDELLRLDALGAKLPRLFHQLFHLSDGRKVGKPAFGVLKVLAQQQQVVNLVFIKGAGRRLELAQLAVDQVQRVLALAAKSLSRRAQFGGQGDIARLHS